MGQAFKRRVNIQTRILAWILVVVSFSTILSFLRVTINSGYAAENDTSGVISKEKCEKYGGRWDGSGFGTAIGVGCLFDAGHSGKGVITSFSDMIDRVDIYYTNNTYCHPSYNKVANNNEKISCEIKSKEKENISKNKINEDECARIGGSWYYFGTYGKTDYCKIKAVGVDYKDSRDIDIKSKADVPDYYRIFNILKFKSCPDSHTLQKKEVSSDRGSFTYNFCMKTSKLDNNSNPTGSIDSDGETADKGSEDKSSCKIDGVGWIICPGANFLAKAAMDSYKFIADNMLQVRSNELFTNSSQDKSSGKSLMEVWGNFRDIANILFVILFSIVIISQITSLGISNYGIKKMLPRLLIFAILINVSYYISVIAVDASNILGRSIYNTIIGSVEWSGAASSGVHSLGQVVAGGLALSTGAVFFGATMFLALMSALIGMVVMIITLMIRQAAVIILVVLSPIAFASAILPNTEGIFNKWKSVFKSMLVIYPMASIVVSLSVLASNTLAATASGPFSFLIEGLYLTLPFVGMAGVVALIRGALAALDKLTNANITGKLSSLAGGANKFMGNTSVAKHAANWSRGNRGALTGRNKNPTTRTGRILSAIGGLGGKRGLGIAATAGYFRNSRLRADSNARVIEENQKWDDEDRSIAILEQKEANGIITDSERRSLNSLRAVKQKREDDQITAQARANAIKWKMAPVKDVLDNSGNIITPSTETLAKTSLANAIASRDSDKIKMAVESAKMVYGQNKTNNMISSYIENNGISQESAHALSNNFYKDFKDSSPSLSSTIEYAKSNSKGIETETVRTMDPATGKMIDKIQANQSQINKAVDGAFDNIKMAVVNNMDAEEVKKWNAALYKMPTPERKMHARMAREAERNGAGDVKQRTELSNLYRIHK